MQNLMYLKKKGTENPKAAMVFVFSVNGTSSVLLSSLAYIDSATARTSLYVIGFFFFDDRVHELFENSSWISLQCFEIGVSFRVVKLVSSTSSSLDEPELPHGTALTRALRGS